VSHQHKQIIGGVAAAIALVTILVLESVSLISQSRGGPAQILTAADVNAVVTAAASALSDSTMAIAVVDRTGQILAVYRRPNADAVTSDLAVSLARTTAFFSNDQAPLSSRTVRFISGIHFPAGIANTGNAALYGVENINRGCQLDSETPGIYETIFNGPNIPPRPRSIAGTFGTGAPGSLASNCLPSDVSGCAVGGPIQGERRESLTSFGITTGKPNLRDRLGDQTSGGFGPTGGNNESVNPGGISLYRGGKLIGGIGVAGVSPERAQYAALIGAGGTRTSTGITAAINFPNALPAPGAIFIDGIRLPFYGSCGTNLACIQRAIDNRPAGSSAGSFSAGAYVITPRGGQQADEGYLIGPCPRGRCSSPGGLTRSDVERIVNQAIARANSIRAQVRLPFGQTATFIIAVTDENGAIVAEYRMADALFDAVDVVPSKARNAYYFSTREGYDVLRSYIDGSRVNREPDRDTYRWEPDPPAGQGWALTSRTLSFGGQPLFPPGIDLEKDPTPGPWFDLFVYDTLNPCTEGPGPSRGGNRSFVNQNGITWFPGSAPLYKNGRLVGGLGVSGDGVEQNDLVTAAGADGFEPPDDLRVDNSVIRTGAGDTVRLPYLKYPRNPERP
jgi:uncharacterized protein GlcG (DUF336 family)